MLIRSRGAAFVRGFLQLKQPNKSSDWNGLSGDLRLSGYEKPALVWGRKFEAADQTLSKPQKAAHTLYTCLCMTVRSLPAEALPPCRPRLAWNSLRLVSAKLFRMPGSSLGLEEGWTDLDKFFFSTMEQD